MRITRQATGRKYLQTPLINNCYAEILKCNNKKSSNPIKKNESMTLTDLTKEDIQRGNKHIKRCSRLYAMRKM